MDDHDRLIQEEFSKQASKFERAGTPLSDPDYLAWVVESLHLQTEWRVLDVAAGTGILSRAMAPHVKDVVAIDITKDMVDRGAEAAAKAQIPNIYFECGSAYALPFPDGTFDFAATRFSLHHFTRPLEAVKEMVRVSKKSGGIGVIDLVAPAEIALAQKYNSLERLRDPSHVRAMSMSELERLVENAGVRIKFREFRDVTVTVRKWLDLASTPLGPAQKIKSELNSELEGGEITGMRPFSTLGAAGKELAFNQTWAVLVGTHE